ncbi:MAG: hypothetical protein AAB882_01090, partial [Patescibacteria group bacterium]
MNTIPHHFARGYIIIFALVVSAAIMAVTVAFFNYYGSAIHAERFAFTSVQAQALAEAGIDKAVYELNQSAGYSGESDIELGNGTYSVSIVSIDGNTKRVTATSYVPNSTNPTAKKVVQATIGIDASVASFYYGVQIGQGG